MLNRHMQFLGMLLTILVFTQCQQASQTSETPPTPTEVAKALNITVDCDMTLPAGCKDYHEKKDSLKVKPDCAKAFISYWQCFADALNRQLESPYADLLKYGFQIPKGELEQIIKDDQAGQIWAMLTVVPDEQGILKPDLFFQGKPKESSQEKSAGDDDDDDFFDFTKPCPTNCPD
ncbi:MAG: hypothetical protein KTR30_27680 [Saprospiraceae bacterium]|nr:hypothetical protein [Saprospiraceae bacterium]